VPQFWLGLCKVAGSETSDPPPGHPLLSNGARLFAVEVVREGEELAVLFSTVEDMKSGDLRCMIGFASSTKTCSLWADRGFPLVDAAIAHKGKTLTVTSPFFAVPGSMQYDSPLLTLEGIEFAPTTGPGADVGGCYRQWLQAPDDGLPATLVERRAITWKPKRTQVNALKPQKIGMRIEKSRSPGLLPFETGEQVFQRVWTGELAVNVDPDLPKHSMHELKREDVFGRPAFRFEDVEVLGFRLDLASLGADDREKLAALIEPLNFHLEETENGGAGGSTPQDFEYRVATTTLVIELLRYGRMKLRTPLAPLVVKDYQSQHELVVRVLVGRVDDDTSQAHSPAIFVPAIFVDNPWSKIIGRELQGFDKWIANFCATRGDKLEPLRPDGRCARDAAGDPMPLASITEIRIAKSLGRADGNTILEVDCPHADIPDFDAFQQIDLDLAMGSTALAGARWQQTDFEAAEFRRSFARAANFKTLKGFRSIQVAPVAVRDLSKTWITGTFVVDDDLRIALPSGVVDLTVHYRGEAPKGWQQLCKILGIDEGGSRRISFPTGSWYRLQCSMSLNIDNGLEFKNS
jgi:hypothetical protein